MTGKQLKRWALLVHDDAEIQIDKGYTHVDWEPIDVLKLRAHYEQDIYPKRISEDCNNLEDVEAQP